MRRPEKRRESGIALIILMMVLLIATLLGVWGLSSSRSVILKAGNRQAANKLQLSAEEGLQKTIRRFQQIMNYDGSQTDEAAAANGSTAKTSYFLVGPGSSTSLCMPPNPPDTSVSCSNPACSGTFNPNTNFDSINQNVVCNFLGRSLSGTQVSVARKTDVVVSSEERDGVFLVSAIATDSAGRRQIVQGVIIVPYNPTTGSALADPYLSTVSKGSD